MYRYMQTKNTFQYKQIGVNVIYEGSIYTYAFEWTHNEIFTHLYLVSIFDVECFKVQLLLYIYRYGCMWICMNMKNEERMFSTVTTAMRTIYELEDSHWQKQPFNHINNYVNLWTSSILSEWMNKWKQIHTKMCERMKKKMLTFIVHFTVKNFTFAYVKIDELLLNNILSFRNHKNFKSYKKEIVCLDFFMWFKRPQKNNWNSWCRFSFTIYQSIYK